MLFLKESRQHISLHIDSNLDYLFKEIITLKYYKTIFLHRKKCFRPYTVASKRHQKIVSEITFAHFGGIDILLEPFATVSARGWNPPCIYINFSQICINTYLIATFYTFLQDSFPKFHLCTALIRLLLFSTEPCIMDN